jgi:DNA-binding MarR family transcriptional regulator
MLSERSLARFNNIGQYLHGADIHRNRSRCQPMNRDSIDSVLRSLRRVNLQGSFFGQTVAVRFGLSESDIETLEQLIEMGATTAGRLSEITGLTSGAVTRVIDRLEQSGYVRRVPDPTDRRRVIVEVVPEKVSGIQSALDRISSAGAEEIGRYTDAQLALIGDFLTRMEQVARSEATNLREDLAAAPAAGSAEHSAPVGGLRDARLAIRSGLSALRLRSGAASGELYRATFEGATPQVRLRDGRVLVSYRGARFDWRKRTATFALNSDVRWAIELVGGIQRVEADLRAVTLAGFDLTGGAERIQLEVGNPAGEAGIRVVGGVKTIRFERPRAVPVRVSVVGGSAEVTLDGDRVAKSGGHSAIASAGFDRATDRYDLTIVGGTKTVEVIGRP